MWIFHRLICRIIIKCDDVFVNAEGMDYELISDTVPIKAGQDTGCISIAIFDDSEVSAEASIFFDVNIDTFGVSTRVFILDDDDGKNYVLCEIIEKLKALKCKPSACLAADHDQFIRRSRREGGLY